MADFFRVKLLERTLPARDLMQLLMRHRSSTTSQPTPPDAGATPLSQSQSQPPAQSLSQPVCPPCAGPGAGGPSLMSIPSASIASSLSVSAPDARSGSGSGPEHNPAAGFNSLLPDFEGDGERDDDEPAWFREIQVRARLDSTPLAGSIAALETASAPTSALASNSAPATRALARDRDGDSDRVDGAGVETQPEHCHCSPDRQLQSDLLGPSNTKHFEGTSVDGRVRDLPDSEVADEENGSGALAPPTPPSLSSCLALPALSPHSSSGQLSTLGADTGVPLRRTPTPPSASSASSASAPSAAAATETAQVMSVRSGGGSESDAEEASASACDLCDRIDTIDGSSNAKATLATSASSAAIADAVATAGDELLAPSAASARAPPSEFLDCAYSSPNRQLLDSPDALAAMAARDKSIGCAACSLHSSRMCCILSELQKNSCTYN